MDANFSNDLESFLSQVDEIESLVKDLNSDNPDNVKNADVYLDKLANKKVKRPPRDNTGVNRSVINHAAFRDDPPRPDPTIPADQQAFVSYIEKDAKERKERRKRQRAEATIIKEEGNKYFQQGDYMKAIELYTTALGVVKDLTAIWTNRAQAYIKVGEYHKALSDCDWAIRCHENCLKGFIHRGRAHLELGQYDDALEAYTRALTIEPGKEKVIREYMREVERRREAGVQEAQAQAFLTEGRHEAEGLVDLLARVRKEEQVTLYYSGGFRIIEKALANNTDRALFRTEGGMETATQHHYVSKCWAASPRSVSCDEIDLLACVLDVYTAAVTDNEENMRRLLQQPAMAECMLKWLESSHKPAQQLQASLLSLLHTVSMAQFGQKLIVDNLDTARLLPVVLNTSRGKAGVNAIALLNNLALNNKFKSQVRGSVEQVLLPALESLMTQTEGATVRAPSVTSLSNLCTDDVVRDKVASRPATWRTCTQLLESLSPCSATTQEVLEATLGLVINLTLDLSKRELVLEALTESINSLCCVCITLGGSTEVAVAERAVAVLSHLLTGGGAAVVDAACEADVIPLLVSCIQSEERAVLRKAGMKALAGCTQSSQTARAQLLHANKGLSSVVGLLKGSDEALVGNAALCLGHVSGEERVAARLTKTNIIQLLLVTARDGHNKQLQHNSSILIAKLAQADQRHLERLRELHGVEILVDVMRHIKT